MKEVIGAAALLAVLFGFGFWYSSQVTAYGNEHQNDPIVCSADGTCGYADAMDAGHLASHE